MTAASDQRPAATAGPLLPGGPRLLRGVPGGTAVVSLGRHRQLHGSMPRLDVAQLIDACEAVRLTGRGGAGFPVAMKLQGLRRGRRAVVVNATESEPASQKDRLLLARVPHLVLDGALLVADAIGARDIRVAVHDGRSADQLAVALSERLDGARVTVEVIEGGYVSGEARAVIRALNGGPALPPGRRSLPTEQGVAGASTFLSNTETFAHLALLATMGSTGYASVGTREEPGTTLVTVGGAVQRPGVLEIALGTPLHAVLSAAGGRPAAGLIVGGYHGTWLPPRPELQIARKALAAAGGTLGAGIILIIDDATCALGELSRVASWLAKESAGQCGPCRSGLPALVTDLLALNRGGAHAEHTVRRHAGLVSGRGACAHPDGAARFVTTGLAALHQEVQTHGRHGGCGRPVLGQLPLAEPGWR